MCFNLTQVKIEMLYDNFGCNYKKFASKYGKITWIVQFKHADEN